VGLSRLVARYLSDSEFPGWRSLLEGSPQASVYSLPEYLDALCSAAGGRFRILGVHAGDAIVGGVALYERDRASGAYVAPRLLLYYNGLVVEPQASGYPSIRTARELKILEALSEGLASSGYASVNLRSHHSLVDVRPFLARGWTAAPSYTYVVPLGEPASPRTRMEQNLRRLISRCSDGAFVLTEDDDFESFFELHGRSLGRHGKGTYLSRPAFRRYLDALRGAGLGLLFHARRAGGRAVATQLVLLGPRGTSHTVSAATHPDEMRSGVTAWLRGQVFEKLSESGRVSNDLTDASLNPVTHFKSQLGGDLRMCLVLQSPQTLPFRAQTRLEAAALGLRARLGEALRPARSASA
jgi:hypothetical protein